MIRGQCIPHGSQWIGFWLVLGLLFLPVADAQSITTGTSNVITQLQVLWSRPSHAHGQPPTVQDSLWETMLLNFAIQRDPLLIALSRKQENLNKALFANAFAIGGLSMGQSIEFFVAPAGLTLPRQIMSMTSSSLVLASLSIQGLLEHRYTKQTKKRINYLTEKVHCILNRLRQGEIPEVVRIELDELVGEHAGKEFIAMWESVYPRPHSKYFEHKDKDQHDENLPMPHSSSLAVPLDDGLPLENMP